MSEWLYIVRGAYGTMCGPVDGLTLEEKLHGRGELWRNIPFHTDRDRSAWVDFMVAGLVGLAPDCLTERLRWVGDGSMGGRFSVCPDLVTCIPSRLREPHFHSPSSVASAPAAGLLKLDGLSWKPYSHYRNTSLLTYVRLHAVCFLV